MAIPERAIPIGPAALYAAVYQETALSVILKGPRKERAVGIRFGPVKVSSRGVRVRVGPRIARVHVGTGRPGISTGIGPFGVYAPIGARRRGKPRRRAPAGNGGGGAGMVFVAVLLAIAGVAYATAWPLIVFHHRHGWGYAWQAEGWWVTAVLAAIYLLGKAVKRRKAATAKASWAPVTGTISWRGTSPDLKLAFAVDGGKTYLIPVAEGNPLLRYRNGDRVSGRWDEQARSMHEIAPLTAGEQGPCHRCGQPFSGHYGPDCPATPSPRAGTAETTPAPPEEGRAAPNADRSATHL